MDDQTTPYVGWTCRSCGLPVAGPHAACKCGDTPKRVDKTTEREVATGLVATAIDAAVRAERKRCAAIVRAHLGGDLEHVAICIEAIKNG